MPNMYFIATVLPERLNAKIVRMKEYMLENYDCRVGLKSPAHITLVPPFWMSPDLEPALTADLELIGQNISPFTIHTAGFSSFPPRTIFIATAPSSELDALKKNVDDFFTVRSYSGMKLDRRPFHPHITIATRDLHKKTFAEAWPYFSEKKFDEEWMAEGISLLRHNQKNWDVVFNSRFER